MIIITGQTIKGGQIVVTNNTRIRYFQCTFDGVTFIGNSSSNHEECNTFFNDCTLRDCLWILGESIIDARAKPSSIDFTYRNERVRL